MKLPAIQFYPADWRKDPGVQSLGYFDRGVWFEILCLMHESPQRGKLLLNGIAMPDEALARVLGLDNQILTTTLTTLLTYGVASRDDETGALISRRMVRDESLRQIRTEAGKKGGNPALLNQKPTTPVKQKPTTGVNQNPTPSSSSSISSSKKKEPDEASDGDPLAQVTDLIEFRGGSREGAGSFLGKCLKNFSRDEVEKVAALAVVNNAQDPKAYMRSILENTARKYVTQAEMNSARTAAETGRPVI